MKPTATPVPRPTVGSIWTSFRSSGKRHLLITGSRGSGKSTLLRALFPEPTPGLTSRVCPGDRVELRDNATGQSAVIGRFDPASPGPENRMAPCPEGFQQVGLPCLTSCQTGWLTIDEVGYLEASCPEYRRALLAVLDRACVAAVVRKQDLPFLRGLLERGDGFVVDLDRPFGGAGCVIMASGLGRRFGGNKLLADFHGRPLLLNVLEVTQGLFARRVVVTRHRAVAQLCRERGVEAVLHDLPHRSDTVRLGLEAVGPVPSCLFCPADQPLLKAHTLAALLLAGADDPASIWRPAFDGTPGAPVLFPGWTFPELRTLPQGQGGRTVLNAHPHRVRLLPIDDPLELADADTPQTLEALEHAASGARPDDRSVDSGQWKVDSCADER